MYCLLCALWITGSICWGVKRQVGHTQLPSVDITNAHIFIFSPSLSLLDAAHGQEHNAASPLLSGFSCKGVTYIRSAPEQDDCVKCPLHHVTQDATKGKTYPIIRKVNFGAIIQEKVRIIRREICFKHTGVLISP
jgi:hypothetical protein